MKFYSGKTLDDALASACSDLQASRQDLYYEIIKETKTLFTKKVEISCFTQEMVREYVENYIRDIVSSMEFDVETVSYIQDGRIYCNINTDHNSILIGRGGVILRALTVIVRSSVSNIFKKRFEISLDINGYKEERYKKVSSMARRLAKQVLKTKQKVELDPMPADERKVMHKVVDEFEHVKTESVGEGRNRHMVISYYE